MFKIVDLRNSKIPTNILWQNFDANKFNKEITNPLNNNEKLFNEIYGIKDTVELADKLDKYTFDFGRIPFGKEESIRVVLTLYNNGGTLVDFKIKFPDETGDIDKVDGTNRS